MDVEGAGSKEAAYGWAEVAGVGGLLQVREQAASEGACASVALKAKRPEGPVIRPTRSHL